MNTSFTQNFKSTLPTIQEDKQMSFSKCICDMIEMFRQCGLEPETGCEQHSNNTEYYETHEEGEQCYCDIYDYPHNEELHYHEDTGFFRNANGDITYFNQEIEEITDLNNTLCSMCGGIEVDNILLDCCKNGHSICTECFYKEKQQFHRQTAEYLRQQRIGIQLNNEEKVQKYEFICPDCNSIEKIKFNTNIDQDQEYSDIIHMKIYQ